MNKTSALIGAALASLLATTPTMAASDAEVAELKKMLGDLKKDYEQRINALEQRLAQAEQQSAQAQQQAALAEQQATEAKASQTQAAAPAATNNTQMQNNAFNPALSVNLQGTAISYSRDPESWGLPGFQLGGEAGLLPEGMSLKESEITASANVDSLFYGQLTLGLHEHEGSTEIDVEEAFVDTLDLPAGVGLRFGRFFAETGRLNTQHSHAWDFVDAPLAAQAFLGEQYKDDGVRLSWLAPLDNYMELGFETLRGESFPGSSDGDQFLGGAQNAFVRYGSDWDISNSYQVGLSYLMTSPDDRSSSDAHAHESASADEASTSFTGNSNLLIADAVWKWAPNGNLQERNLTLQAEYYYRDENGDVTFSEGDGNALFGYDGQQWGYYAQAAYQFMPRWRVGLRYDRLGTDNSLNLLDSSIDEPADVLADETGLVSDYNPSRLSAMLDWTPSEFSRIRLQYSRDKSQPEADDQIFLQYIMSLGAHGSHSY